MKVTDKIKEVNKQIENLLVAQALVQDIPDEKWVPELYTWAMVCEDPTLILKNPNQALEECDSNNISKNTLLNHCGSAACFGGWVAVHPHFTKQGVKRSPDGAPFFGEYETNGDPNYDDDTYQGSSSVSGKLFGDWGMFDSMHGNSNSPKKEVMRRIENALVDRAIVLGNFEKMKAAGIKEFDPWKEVM